MFCLHHRHNEKFETFSIVGTDYKNYLILYGCHAGFEALYILETVKPALSTSTSDENVFAGHIDYIEVKPKFKELENFKNFTFKTNTNLSLNKCSMFCRNLINANYMHMNEKGCGKYSAKFLNTRKAKHNTEPQITWVMKLVLLIMLLVIPTVLMFSEYFTKYFV